MRDLPFVPFFTSDWLASSARVDMTLPERAIYLDLLFQIWERGGAISSDEARLAKMAMVTPAEFSSAWSAVRKYLVVHPDEPEMLTNLKMLDVIRKQANVHEARSSAGRRGAASRWADGKGDGKTDGGAMAKTWHPESESESETERERQKNTFAHRLAIRVLVIPLLLDQNAKDFPSVRGKRRTPNNRAGSLPGGTFTS
jgi:uncharacterized protein YdaU (DUF1376 family)